MPHLSFVIEDVLILILSLFELNQQQNEIMLIALILKKRHRRLRSGFQSIESISEKYAADIYEELYFPKSFPRLVSALTRCIRRFLLPSRSPSALSVVNKKLINPFCWSFLHEIMVIFPAYFYRSIMLLICFLHKYFSSTMFERGNVKSASSHERWKEKKILFSNTRCEWERSKCFRFI